MPSNKSKFLFLGLILVIFVAIGVAAEYWPKIIPPEEKEETILTKDNFTITLPPDWKEVAPPDESVLLMAVDTKEQITNEKAKELGFQTNFSLKNDDLARYAHVYTLGEYVDTVKASLIQALPDIKFTLEEQNNINGRPAIFLECESAQEGIEFGTLLVFIEGKDNLLWAVSFNTFRTSWPDYQDRFYQIAKSFQLK